MINVFIAEDQTIVLDGLQALLKEAEGIRVVATASDGKGALEILKNHSVDLALLDIQMPEPNGIEVTKIIKEKYPEVKVLILSQHEEIEYIKEVDAIQGDGYLLKNTDKGELIYAIKHIAAGGFYFSKRVMEIEKEHKRNGKEVEKLNLTKREKQILLLTKDGYSAPMISEELSIAPSTVITHRKNLKTKLGLNSILDLVRYATQNDHLL